MHICGLILNREIKLAFRQGGGALAACGFSLVVFAVFAFALGPDALHAAGRPILVVTVFLASLLALPQLFERDFRDGTLEQYLLSPTPLEIVVAAKITAFWLAYIVPVIALSPVLALMCGLDMTAAATLTSTLLLTTPTLAGIGALGALLTLGTRGAGFTQALVVLPLYLPPLIFATTSGGFYFLLAMACIAVPLTSFLCTLLLRMVYD